MSIRNKMNDGNNIVNRLTKTTNKIMILEAYAVITIFLVYTVTHYSTESFLEVVPTIIFFGFWISQIRAHGKDLEKQLINLVSDEKKIKSIVGAEFKKSFFYEIAVLTAVNYFIMTFKYSNPYVDLISLAIMAFCVILGYSTSKYRKYENYIPIFGIAAASLLVGECGYFLDGHKSTLVLFSSTLISSIIIDGIYLINHYVYGYSGEPRRIELPPATIL